jgi:hypothetical protein
MILDASTNRDGALKFYSSNFAKGLIGPKRFFTCVYRGKIFFIPRRFVIVEIDGQENNKLELKQSGLPRDTNG